MPIQAMVIKELLYRKLNSFMSWLAIAIAAGAIISCFGLLKLFDTRTERLIAEKQALVIKENAALEDEYRRITLKMGFNIMILPENQDMTDLYTNDFASKTMPEWYADTLARSRIVTIQHLLPVLQQKVKWPEKKRSIILVGTRGEIPIAASDAKKSLLDPVQKGSIMLGFELSSSNKIKKGDIIKLMGKSFKVAGCYPERGTKDDITAWINLSEAQEMMHMPGLINGIMALECSCAMAKLDIVRKELAGILPHTKVIEFASQALTRAEARKKAADYAKASLESEKDNRSRMRSEKDAFFSIFLLLLLAATAVSVGLMAYSNVRERRVEIGIFRSIGFSSGKILAIFILRAVFIGATGGIAGCIAGIIFTYYKFTSAHEIFSLHAIINPLFALCIFAGTVILSAAASWLPALIAVNQDPAIVLRQE